MDKYKMSAWKVKDEGGICVNLILKIGLRRWILLSNSKQVTIREWRESESLEDYGD